MQRIIHGIQLQIITREPDQDVQQLEPGGLHLQETIFKSNKSNKSNQKQIDKDNAITIPCCCRMKCLLCHFIFLLFLFISVLALWSDRGMQGAAPVGKWVCKDMYINSTQEEIQHKDDTDILGSCDLVPWSASDPSPCRWVVFVYILGTLNLMSTLVARLTLSGLSLGDYNRMDDLRRIFSRKVCIHYMNMVGSFIVLIALLLWSFGCHNRYLLGIPTGVTNIEAPVSSLTIIWYCIFLSQFIFCTVELCRYHGCPCCRREMQNQEEKAEEENKETEKNAMQRRFAHARQATQSASSYVLQPGASESC
jgi:hypothetical protein